MTLPTADTPLYNHPLNQLEQWLQAQGCETRPKRFTLLASQATNLESRTVLGG